MRPLLQSWIRYMRDRYRYNRVLPYYHSIRHTFWTILIAWPMWQFVTNTLPPIKVSRYIKWLYDLINWKIIFLSKKLFLKKSWNTRNLLLLGRNVLILVFEKNEAICKYGDSSYINKNWGGVDFYFDMCLNEFLINFSGIRVLFFKTLEG